MCSARPVSKKIKKAPGAQRRLLAEMGAMQKLCQGIRASARIGSRCVAAAKATCPALRIHPRTHQLVLEVPHNFRRLFLQGTCCFTQKPSGSRRCRICPERRAQRPTPANTRARIKRERAACEGQRTPLGQIMKRLKPRLKRSGWIPEVE